MTDQGTLRDFFEQRCADYADKIAFTCLGHSLRYADLDRHATALAVFLQSDLGLEPGDRIAIQLPNLLQYPVAVVAAIRAGLVVVNTNPLYTERELSHQLRDSGVKAALVMADFAATLATVQNQTDVRHVIVTEAADMHPAPKRFLINGFLRLKRLFKSEAKVRAPVRFRDALARGREGELRALSGDSDNDRQSMAVLQYTGGTTGLSKGAMLTHANLLSNVSQVDQHLGHNLSRGEEIMVAPLPVYHIFAFMLTMLLAIDIGARVILIPDPRDQRGFLRALKGVPFTFFAGLNTLFNALCRNPRFRTLNFSHLHITVSGGMALTKAAAERWQQVTGCRIIEGYGLTETSPVVSINPVEAPKLGTVGLLVPDTECRMLDEGGEPVAEGEPGELWIRGPQVMKGYWQQQEATRDMLDDEGWLHTGDIAAMDEDGYLRIVDRLKDMIIVSGFNVYPNELEDAISAHPDVVECAAIGIPDPESVEAVKLFVVTSNPDLSADDIRHFARKTLTAYKVPRHIAFVDDLPKSNVGKVLRKELRAQEEEKASG